MYIKGFSYMRDGKRVKVKGRTVPGKRKAKRKGKKRGKSATTRVMEAGLI